MQKKEPIKTNMHNQETDKGSETKCCQCRENYIQTTKEDDSIYRARETSCLSSPLHTKTNVSTAVESYCERKTAK
jgi:hypothetical protein